MLTIMALENTVNRAAGSGRLLFGGSFENYVQTSYIQAVSVELYEQRVALGVLGVKVKKGGEVVFEKSWKGDVKAEIDAFETPGSGEFGFYRYILSVVDAANTTNGVREIFQAGGYGGIVFQTIALEPGTFEIESYFNGTIRDVASSINIKSYGSQLQNLGEAAITGPKGGTISLKQTVVIS